MQHKTIQSDSPADNASAPMAVWFEAVARRRCVSAVYNSTPIILAPHVLYLRAGQPYIAGVVTQRRGIGVEQRRIGIFAVLGLREPRLTAQGFDADAGYSPSDARWADAKLLGIEAPAG